ncbi:4Fe-4S binding protein [Aphanothece hegewaldii]|nr:4Fe-4S binding protein [Aphanothece hegewaldii]
MHTVRWIITSGWLLLIFSLFYDPISANLFTFSTLNNSATCIKVQGICLSQKPYPLGNSIFWGLIIPISIFILFVFGHEFWRRICPLSFLSQIPRALGKQRRISKIDPKTGQKRHELIKIKPDSWLGRNHLYFQFGFLYLGVCSRILFLDSHRLLLGIFLLATIVFAITIGYFYAGKTWCHYFCPMGTVQIFYGEPRGLLTSIAHNSDKNPITQSMCRHINPENKIESACVACTSPCLDIDAERSYWERFNRSDYKFISYGYVGLVIGFFFYYYLYSGDWRYWFNGAWSHDETQLKSLFSAGFYLDETAIAIPKLVAVPLTIGLSTFLSYLIGKKLEKAYKSYQLQRDTFLNSQQVQHQIFTLCTFFTFNLFFIFAARTYINILPIQLQYIYNISLVILSTIWLYRTWGRSRDLYAKEGLASRLRKQLNQLQLDVSRFLEGRSLERLNVDEVYILAKILPGFTGEKKLRAYKGVLKEALEEGYVNSASSLEVLRQMRQELGISEDEHLQAITELGIENIELLDPNIQRTRENQLRLFWFKQRIKELVTHKRRRGATGLGRELLKVIKKEKSVHEVLKKDHNSWRNNSQEYNITPEEEVSILAELEPESQFIHRSNILLDQLQQLADSYQALENKKLAFKPKPYLVSGINILQKTIQRKQKLFAKGILELLENLENSPDATHIAIALASLAPQSLLELLSTQENDWEKRLNSFLLARIRKQIKYAKTIIYPFSEPSLIPYLEVLVDESDSLTKAVSLYLMAYLDILRGQQKAIQLLESYLILNPLVKETAQTVLNNHLTSQNTLLKLLYLSSCELFDNLKSEQLLDLAYQANFKTYHSLEMILNMGELNHELLILVEGEVKEERENGQFKTFIITPVQTLNQVELLAQIPQMSNLIAMVSETKVLALDSQCFDTTFAQNQELMKKVISQLATK